MKKDLPPGTVRLLVREAAGVVTGQHYVDWAVQLLAERHDSPSLRRLAASDLDEVPGASDCAQILTAVLAELELSRPDNEVLIRDYVREVARDIIAGNIAPQAGAERIHREVLGPFLHPKDLQAWCYLWEGLSPQGDGQTLAGSALDEAIHNTALAWAGDA